MRCQHTSATVFEIIEREAEWSVVDGVINGDGYFRDGYPTGNYRVVCTECKRDCVIATAAQLKRAPQWAAIAVRAITDRSV